MSFFDSKEEVLNIELTAHGKYLLSKGLFKPEAYAFFDDDIIYDSEYAGATEEQNSVETRILEESLYLKPFVSTTNKEKSVNFLREHFVSYDGSRKFVFNEEDKTRTLPLGNSSTNSDYAPAWDLTTLKGNILSTNLFTNNNGKTNNVLIPQINLKDTEIKLEIIKQDSSLAKFNTSINTLQLEDGTLLEVIDDYLLLELNEKNVDDLKKNFDIEFYLVDGDETSDSSNYQKLIFAAKPEQIIDGLLVDTTDMPTIKPFDDLEPSYVQHYFDVLADDEIDRVAFERYINGKQIVAQNALSGTYTTNVVGPTSPEDC